MHRDAKNKLREIALQARERAYAPYSRFRVGAALLSKSGAIFSGCNVENISLGLTMCAERVCIGKAVEGGERIFESLVIVADSDLPIVPCGACRQVLAEFSPFLDITSWTLPGKSCEFQLEQLLPLPTQGIDIVPRGT
jgi:cytidine deaminase